MPALRPAPVAPETYLPLIVLTGGTTGCGIHGAVRFSPVRFSPVRDTTVDTSGVLRFGALLRLGARSYRLKGF